MTIFELVEFEAGRHFTIRLRWAGFLFGEVVTTYLLLPDGGSRCRLLIKLLMRHSRRLPALRQRHEVMPASLPAGQGHDLPSRPRKDRCGRSCQRARLRGGSWRHTVHADKFSGAVRGHDSGDSLRTVGLSFARRQVQWRDSESNRGHYDFQSYALPTELSRRDQRS
jgi:hypothetical protein